MSNTLNVAVIGASGYTGADAVRLLLGHPLARLTALTAERHAGQPIDAVFGHLTGYGLPDLVKIGDVDWGSIDAAICALPHGTTQEVIAGLPSDMKVVDLSADFRLDDPQTYAAWYGHDHRAVHLQGEAAYGLTELNRQAIGHARIVANPGCFPTASLLALQPVVAKGLIDPDAIVIDAKTGVTGAGRSVKQANLFAEVAEGVHPYGVGHHRHMPEMEQELSKVAGRSVTLSFTPHLLPMKRGELITAYVKLVDGAEVSDLKTTLSTVYADEPFVHVLAEGRAPATRDVTGSNLCHINVFADRRPGHAIIVAAIDNLVKGSSGGAIQNLNLICGFPEETGLKQVALFP
ncbi:MAG: N-acetyl-gamma-glutamyl-phosphate reductase [Pseudomonadota bacterium]